MQIRPVNLLVQTMMGIKPHNYALLVVRGVGSFTLSSFPEKWCTKVRCSPHLSSYKDLLSLGFSYKPWKSFSRVRFFETPWTIQSMEFSRPEYWSGYSLSLLHGIFLTQELNQGLLHWTSSPAWGFFTSWATREAPPWVSLNCHYTSENFELLPIQLL